MGFDFSPLLVDTPHGSRRALVMTPNAEMVVGRDRLEHMRRDDSPSQADRGLLDELDRLEGEYHLAIFRGSNDEGTCFWRFDEALLPAEVAELAERLTVSHFPMHQALVRHGLSVFVHTDFTPTIAMALRDAARTVMARIGEAPDADDDDRRLQVYLLRHLTFYFSLSIEKTLTDVLPDKLPLIERKLPKLQSLLPEPPPD